MKKTKIVLCKYCGIKIDSRQFVDFLIRIKCCPKCYKTNKEEINKLREREKRNEKC
jgi:hypothetical protein